MSRLPTAPSTPPSSSTPGSPPRHNNNPFASPLRQLSPSNPFVGASGSLSNGQSERWNGGLGGAWSGSEGLAESSSSRQVLSEWGFGEGEGANPWGAMGGSGGAGGFAAARPASEGSAAGLSGQSTLAGTPSLRYTTPSPNGQLPSGAAPSAYMPQQPDPAPPLPRRPPMSSTSASLPPILPPRNSSLLPETQSTSTSSSNTLSALSKDLFGRSRFAKGKEVATPNAEPTAPHPPSRPQDSNGTSEPPEFTSFDLATRSIIREAMDELIKFHADELFLHRLQAPPSSSSPRPIPSPPTRSRTNGAPLEHDAATESFINAFPSLSRPPSPIPAQPSHSASTSSPAPTSGFEEKTHRMTGLLLWQLKSLVDEEIARGAQGWREEKRRGMQEVEELERELNDESEGKRRAEEEVRKLKAANRALETQIQDSSASHNLDLEAAARASTDLSERVEILQQALNDQDQEQDARVAAGADEGDNVWLAIVDSQSELLTKHGDALSALASPLSCVCCQEVLNNPTTLPCGHSGCTMCFDSWLKGSSRTCPSCRSPVPLGHALSPSFNLAQTVRILKDIGLGEEGAGRM